MVYLVYSVYLVCSVTRTILTSLSWHQTPDIHRWKLVFTLSLVFVERLHAGHSIKVIVGILTGPADEEVFLLINQVPARIFTLFEVRDELDRVGRTGLLAHAAIDAPRKVDPEECRIAAVLSFRIVRG